MNIDKIFGIAWENIFIGLVGGFVVSFINYLYKVIKEKIIERKFPIRGFYITKFEDEIDGKKVVCTAPAEIKQKGNKIIGKTYMPTDKRSWVIEGEISSNGHIYGIYYAEDPIDKGIGNFFLKVDNRRRMVGLWSGYDSVNGKITSGKYEFYPVLTEVKIMDMKKVNIPQIIEISDEELGKDYLNYNDIEKMIDNKENYICRVAYLNESNKIVGFCLCYIVTPDKLQSILKVELNRIPRFLLHSDKIGVIKTVAVEKKYQGYGIGKRLVEDSYKELENRGVQSVFSVAWKNNGEVNMDGILTLLGFKKYIEIERYWEAESLEKGYFCPVCGKPPCICSAVIYAKAVNSKL